MTYNVLMATSNPSHSLTHTDSVDHPSALITDTSQLPVSGLWSVRGHTDRQAWRSKTALV